MTGSIILPGNTGLQIGTQDMAQVCNALVKRYYGRARPFVMLVYKEDGQALIISNMDKPPEVKQFLSQVAERIPGV